MARFIGAVCVAVLVSGLVSSVRAGAGEEPKVILDKAIQALGGEEKLNKARSYTLKAKGKITFAGNENEFVSEVTVQGLDRYRQVFEGEFGGNPVKGVVVLAGDKGWRHFGDNRSGLEGDALANQKRSVYLQVIPATLLPLKDKAFKLETAGEEKVGGKPALGLKVTPADGKEFTIYFDKESGLPVKQVARVRGLMGGEEFTMETTFADYKDFGGIKKATRIENKRDGEPFLSQQITEFKVLDKVDPQTFTEPQ